MGIKDIISEITGQPKEKAPDPLVEKEAKEESTAAAAATGPVVDEETPRAVYSPDDDAPMRPIHEDAEEEDGEKTVAPAEPEEEASLECAPSGQVRNIVGAKTVFDLNREELGVLRRERKS